MVRCTDRPAITIAVELGCKATKQNLLIARYKADTIITK